MLTQVDAIEGYGRQMAPLNTVINLWGNAPEVPARKAVWLASAATDGKTGLEVSVLTPSLLIGGALRQLGRRMLRRPNRIKDVNVTE